MEKSKIVVEFRFKGNPALDAREFDTEQEAQSFIWQHRNIVIYGPAEVNGVMEAIPVDLRLGDWDWFVQRVISVPVSA